VAPFTSEPDDKGHSEGLPVFIILGRYTRSTPAQLEYNQSRPWNVLRELYYGIEAWPIGWLRLKSSVLCSKVQRNYFEEAYQQDTPLAR
jgi:hypothetical protein